MIILAGCGGGKMSQAKRLEVKGTESWILCCQLQCKEDFEVEYHNFGKIWGKSIYPVHFYLFTVIEQTVTQISPNGSCIVKEL